MTNSKAGLEGRLKQFDKTVKTGKQGHGGADRVKYAYQEKDKLIPKLYVSIWYFECDVKRNRPKDLRIMGDVAKAEYDCFAEYRNLYGVLPTFNHKDSKIAPKYSLEVKKGNIKQ